MTHGVSSKRKMRFIVVIDNNGQFTIETGSRSNNIISKVDRWIFLAFSEFKFIITLFSSQIRIVLWNISILSFLIVRLKIEPVAGFFCAAQGIRELVADIDDEVVGLADEVGYVQGAKKVLGQQK